MPRVITTSGSVRKNAGKSTQRNSTNTESTDHRDYLKSYSKANLFVFAI
jgi:hypothetical protein